MNKMFLSKKIIFYVCLILLSFALLAMGAFYLINKNNYIKKGDEVEATVVNILVHPDVDSESYEKDLKEYNELLEQYRYQGIIDDTTAVAIIIEYSHNGEDFTTELGYFAKDIKIAQDITIYVNPNNSKDFIVEGRNDFTIYFCLIGGGLIFLVCALLLFVDVYNKHFANKMREKGTLLEAVVLYADEDRKNKSFNRCAYIFTCEYKDPETGEETYFTSDSIFSKNKGTSYIGKKVKVYVDPKDFTNYFVDYKSFETE